VAEKKRSELEDLLASQAKIKVRRARDVLNRARRGDLDSIQPLCESLRDLQHALDLLTGNKDSSDLRHEARELLARLERLVAALARHVATESARLDEGRAPSRA